MTRRLVASREYKVMLLPERFAGSEDAARRTVDEFWADLGRVLDEIDVPTEGSFDEVKAHRRIRFFDTAERSLNGQRYIFRERIDVESDERQVTLKYRHSDRYVAQDRDMDAKGRGDDAETKFEEDVKPPFVSVFSYSTSVKVDADQRFERVEEIAELFPGLPDKLDDVGGESGLAVVRDFCARELVLVGASVLLGKRDIAAECAMVMWHDDDDVSTPPVCVEFSFKYGDDEEDYRGTVARDAHDVLHVINTKLPEWVHPEPVTKTAFVYG
jgi:hypothetical protein